MPLATLLTMIFVLGAVFGGFAFCLYHLMRHNRHLQHHHPEDDTSCPSGEKPKKA